MAQLLKAAQAGTIESSDILINLSPASAGSGIKVELISPTIQQYGAHITQLITDTLATEGITDALVHANEKGALDYTIIARIKTAVERSNS